MSTSGENEMKEAAVGYKTETQFPALHDPKYPVHAIASRLEPYLRVIVDQIHPEKIILFGSYAYGQPTEHSDFDLLVVRKDITSEKESNLQIRRAFDLIPGVPPPFTILSKTPQRISNRLAVHSPLYEDILTKGLVLYAA